MKPIRDCINPRLLALCQKSAQIQQLSADCLQFLREDLRTHCQVVQFNQGRLVLSVSDPVWATELRYALPELRDALRTKGGLYQLRAIEIKIGMPVHITAPVKKRKTKPLTPAARHALTVLSESCGFEPLKDAVQRLAMSNE